MNYPKIIRAGRNRRVAVPRIQLTVHSAEDSSSTPPASIDPRTHRERERERASLECPAGCPPLDTAFLRWHFRPGRIQTGTHTILAVKSRLESLQDGEWEALAREAKYKPESLAALCRVSLRQLERCLHKRFGKTPSAWLLELRIRQAEGLLRQGYSTQAIAQELGFANAAHFCHAFKKVHGLPPQPFRPLDPPDVARRQ